MWPLLIMLSSQRRFFLGLDKNAKQHYKSNKTSQIQGKTKHTIYTTYKQAILIINHDWCLSTEHYFWLYWQIECDCMSFVQWKMDCVRYWVEMAQNLEAFLIERSFDQSFEGQSVVALSVLWSSVFRGCPRVGTVVQWQWSNPPGRLADTQRWAAPRGPSSSIGAWAHAGSWDSPGGRASCNHALLAPRLPGCSCLRTNAKHVFFNWEKVVGPLNSCAMLCCTSYVEQLWPNG